MTPEEASALYRTASTPAEAARLIEHRGRPDLAIYVQGFTRVPPAATSAELFRIWSRLVGIESGWGWFERAENVSRHNPPTLESARQVRAIMRWMVDVFTRYAPLQPPLPSEGPIAATCETCGAELRKGVDCCVPKKPRSKADREKRRKPR